jgi:PAS fold
MSNGVVTVAVDEFLMVVDGSGVVVQCSRHAQELVGCTAEEVAGQPVAHLVTGVAAGVRSDARPGRAGVVLSGVGGHAVRPAGAAHAAAGRRCGMGCLPGQRGARP